VTSCGVTFGESGLIIKGDLSCGVTFGESDLIIKGDLSCGG
jgi:hypothetical protein